MNRVGLITFLGRVQGELANLFPATVRIGDTDYACSRSKIERDRDLLTGGWLNKFRVTFILRVAQFTDIGKPVPAGRTFLQFESQTWVAANVRDATGTLLTLRCESPEQ